MAARHGVLRPCPGISSDPQLREEGRLEGTPSLDHYEGPLIPLHSLCELLPKLPVDQEDMNPQKDLVGPSSAHSVELYVHPECCPVAHMNSFLQPSRNKQFKLIIRTKR